MLTPAYRPLHIALNADPWVDSFTIGSRDDTGVFLALDVSGYAARLQIRLNQGDAGTPLLEVASATKTAAGSVINMGGGIFGQIEVQLFADDTDALPYIYQPNAKAPTCEYDLLLTNPAGQQGRYAYGPVFVHPGVTRV